MRSIDQIVLKAIVGGLFLTISWAIDQKEAIWSRNYQYPGAEAFEILILEKLCLIAGIVLLVLALTNLIRLLRKRDH
ncbi:hypothetical protein KFE98_18655 [bacterium SCSIO 12741]|nr:hypothetical protein KFE98_18655 [bacterium SCSIO 12741]